MSELNTKESMFKKTFLRVKGNVMVKVEWNSNNLVREGRGVAWVRRPWETRRHFQTGQWKGNECDGWHNHSMTLPRLQRYTRVLEMREFVVEIRSGDKTTTSLKGTALMSLLVPMAMPNGSTTFWRRIIENESIIVGFLELIGEKTQSERCMELEDKSSMYWCTRTDEVHVSGPARARSQLSMFWVARCHNCIKLWQRLCDCCSLQKELALRIREKEY